MPVPQGSTSYEPARHRQYIFTEYEYNDAKEDPKAAHLCLLPPCQSAFHFDNFCIGPVFIDNAVPINHFFSNGTGISCGLFSSEWPSEPSLFIHASETANGVSR